MSPHTPIAVLPTDETVRLDSAVSKYGACCVAQVAIDSLDPRGLHARTRKATIRALTKVQTQSCRTPMTTFEQMRAVAGSTVGSEVLKDRVIPALKDACMAEAKLKAIKLEQERRAKTKAAS